MEKCSCYREYSKNIPVYNHEGLYSYTRTETKAYCIGTRECDPCSCGGDKSKCDFYDNVRKEGQKEMNTAYMTKSEAEEKFNIKIID